MKRISLYTVVVIIFCLLTDNVYAGISIDPMTVETSAEAGKESIHSFKISNIGDKLANVSVRLEDWLGSGIIPSKWLKILPLEFSIEPKKTVDVNYLFNLPKDAAGEYMTMVFFTSVDEGSNVGVALSVPVYVTVKDTEVVEAVISELQVKFNHEKGLYGSFVVENKGNVHIRPNTIINVIDSNGKTAGYFNVQFGLPVQAGKSRRYDFSNNELKLNVGKYKIVVISDYGTLYGLDNNLTKEVELEIR